MSRHGHYFKGLQTHYGRKLVSITVRDPLVYGVNLLSLAPHTTRKEGIIHKLFHQKHPQENRQQGNESHPADAKELQKNENEIGKLEGDINKDKQEFKDYLKEDKKMEKEDDEYGGLM